MDGETRVPLQMEPGLQGMAVTAVSPAQLHHTMSEGGGGKAAAPPAQPAAAEKGPAWKLERIHFN